MASIPARATVAGFVFAIVADCASPTASRVDSTAVLVLEAAGLEEFVADARTHEHAPNVAGSGFFSSPVVRLSFGSAEICSVLSEFASRADDSMNEEALAALNAEFSEAMRPYDQTPDDEVRSFYPNVFGFRFDEDGRLAPNPTRQFGDHVFAASRVHEAGSERYVLFDVAYSGMRELASPIDASAMHESRTIYYDVAPPNVAAVVEAAPIVLIGPGRLRLDDGDASIEWTTAPDQELVEAVAHAFRRTVTDVRVASLTTGTLEGCPMLTDALREEQETWRQERNDWFKEQRELREGSATEAPIASPAPS